MSQQHCVDSSLFQKRRRSQTNSVDSSQWNFDLLDSKVSNTNSRAASESPVQHSLDPFDMDSLVKETKAVSSPSPAVSHTQKQVVVEEEDDNPLGILAEPARPRSAQKVVASRSPSPPPTMKSHQSPAQHHDDSTSGSRLTLTEEEEDAMLVQLIDMGFSLQESKFAIEATGGGTLQAAVDLLVQSSETVQRRQPSVKQSTPRQQNRELSQTERASAALFSNDVPPPSSSSPRRQQQQDTTTSQQDSLQQQTEKIVNQAQEFGGFLYKNASSFLKTGREKVTKAVGDWQEQQRTARMNQMKEEQSGSVRPKWMVDGDDAIDVTADSKGMEKFADDDDSDNENDLEAERRKIQEMRRLQEQKQREAAAAAHKARQQKNSRKEALIFEEEVYVSPSRRRGGNTPSSSGRSTPKPTGSPQMQQQQQQAPVAQRTASQSPKKRTRPVITAPSDIMAKVNEARTQGNEKFKLGQFGEAEEFYTRAIEILPVGHDHHVLLSNNRATTRLKIGNYKKCVEDCDIAISLARDTGGEASSVSEGVTIQWRDQMIKSLYRKAEALENIEKYKEALATYDELVKLEGVGNPKVNQGMSRCRQALNPKKPVAVSKKAETSSTSQSHQEKKQDFMSMFDPSTKSSSSASTPVVNQEELSKSKAVAAMRASAAKQEAEDAEKLEKTDEVNARLIAWKVGKEQNLRALLATLDTLLWPGAQWKGAQMSELINPKKCKITYMKAIGKVHPDKVRLN